MSLILPPEEKPKRKRVDDTYGAYPFMAPQYGLGKVKRVKKVKEGGSMDLQNRRILPKKKELQTQGATGGQGFQIVNGKRRWVNTQPITAPEEYDEPQKPLTDKEYKNPVIHLPMDPGRYHDLLYKYNKDQTVTKLSKEKNASGIRRRVSRYQK